MFDSMFTSMASSMQLAEECLKTSDEVDEGQEDFASQEPLSGLEHCAQTIDAGESDLINTVSSVECHNSRLELKVIEIDTFSVREVLSRVKMCFRDTVIRVEKYQRGGDVGVGLEFHIKL
jgi:hypothetical protein